MKIYNERDLRRLNWFGLKPMIASLILFPPVNFVFRVLGRNLLTKKQALRYPISTREVRYRLENGAQVTLLDPARDDVARSVYWGEGSPVSPAESHVLRCVEALCGQYRTFLDIGAFSGLFALLAARSNAQLRSIAFEIVPENFLLLMRNIIENDLVGRVEARLCGLAGEPGWMTMAPELKLDRLASSMSIGSEFKTGVQIPLATIDGEMTDAIGPVLMKIDVEGFEAEVLRGGMTFLERHRPDVICEILPDSKDHQEIQDMLSALGYEYFLFTDNGLIRSKTITPTKEGRDWLFCADTKRLLSKIKLAS